MSMAPSLSADLLRGDWEVKALCSTSLTDRYYVQIEHDEPARGGWIRYVLGDAITGCAYFPSLRDARIAACQFLAQPTLTACVTF